MKTRIISFLVAVTCLAAALPAQSQAISGLNVVTAPATNDTIVVRDVSDTAFTANGRVVQVPVHSFFELFAATNLPYLTTTGRITIQAGNSFNSKFLLKTPNDTTSGSLEIGNADQSWGWTFTKAGSGGGFNQDLLITSTVHGRNALRASTNGWVKINDTTAAAAALDVTGTVLASGLTNTGPTRIGDAAADTLQVDATGEYPNLQRFTRTAGVQHNHGNQSGAVTFSSLTNRHKLTATGNPAVTIGGTLPASPAVFVIEYEMLQDATGGRTNTFAVVPFNGYPAVNTNANATTLIQLRTSDAGTSWFASSSYGTDASGFATEAYVTSQISALGVRSEFIPVAWMKDTGATTPDTGANVTSGNGSVFARRFVDSADRALTFEWQRPRDAIDGDAASNFQMKWRWVGLAPAAGLSSDTIAFDLAGVGKASGDSINSTFGTASLSSATGLTESPGDVVYGPWAEVTFVSTSTGWVTWWIESDTATGSDHFHLSGVELLYAVNPRAVTYASP